MMDKYLKNLELDKILELAAQRAVCPETRLRLLAETPQTRPEDAEQLLAQTHATAAGLLKKGSPRLSACEGADQAALRAAKGGVLSMAELLLVRWALRNFSALADWHRTEQQESSALDDLFYTVTPQPGLEQDIGAAILSESEMADTASSELYSLRRKIRQAEASVRAKLDAVIKSPSQAKHLQEVIVSIRNGRYVVPVKAEYRNEVAGVIHDVSSSGSTLFVEPLAVVEANARILQLKNQEQAEIERILDAFSQRVAEIQPLFEASYDAMLELDRRLAKAELGLQMDGVMPAVNTDMHFNLVKARHPLLSRGTVVPVDIQLGHDYDTLVITGPNTGGKTVSLKTAGLLCAMAQLGYLIPAHDSSSVCVFANFLVDIGDEQSIEQSLSTFSGHMRNITDILQHADAKSLVLLDELGAGTDPAEGAALAVAIIEALRRCNARIMATTHYAELKMFALDTPGVQNAGSEFDIETLRPTYRLLVGVPGRSNAFLIGEKLGIPTEVIESARGHMTGEQRRFETVLVQLEDVKLALKQQEEESERLRYAADHALELAEKKREELIRQGEVELDAARRKAKALADDVERSAYSLMDEMRRMEKDEKLSAAQKARRARQIARQDALRLYADEEGGGMPAVQNHLPLERAEVGQEVWLPEMGKTAMVTAGADKTGQVEVRMGALKTKLPLEKLAALPKTEKKPPHSRGGGVSRQKAEGGARGPGTELNLLGRTVDEALMETDQFLDDAVMHGLNVVYIIHGRGTGALRSAIVRHLRGNKHVKSHRLGQYGEGEDGVTVVELK